MRRAWLVARPQKTMPMMADHHEGPNRPHSSVTSILLARDELPFRIDYAEADIGYPQLVADPLLLGVQDLEQVKVIRNKAPQDGLPEDVAFHVSVQLDNVAAWKLTVLVKVKREGSKGSDRRCVFLKQRIVDLHEMWGADAK